MSHTLPKSMSCGPAKRKLRIAIVYSRVPFPMMRGDQMTVAHLISFLSARGHSVDLHTLPLDGTMTPPQAEWLHSVCNKVSFYPHGRARRLWGLITGVLHGLPFQIGMFSNPALKRALRDAANRGDYDLIYCYYPRTAPSVPHLSGGGCRTPTVLALQLSQTLNTERMAQQESNPLKRLVYALEARMMGRFESHIWQDFDRVVLIGPADVEAVRESCRRHGQPEIDNWIYGAHGTDTEKLVPATPAEIVPKRVVFSGSMLYPPNIQAVLWFVEGVWPKVIAEVPEASFIIQGRDPASEILRLHGKNNVVVTGTVQDVGEIIRSAQVCVNPVLAAGGMQNKLIEYMASAKAVVASSVANEGIQAPSEVLVVADGEEAFARAVLELLDSLDSAIELGERAREYVTRRWTWEAHFLQLESDLMALLDERASRP